MAKNIGTKQQNEIIKSKAPVKRIIACAGSGKTWVLTNSIAAILEEKKCNPDEILAVTFTKNAAENMRIRIDKRLKGLKDISSMDIHTFNSFGNDIVYENSFELGLGKDFRLISGSQSWQILYEILKDFSFSHIRVGRAPAVFLQNMLGFIQNLKNNLISTEDFYKYISEYEKILASYKSRALSSGEEGLIGGSSELFEIYLEYEKIKSNRNTIDYQDQVFMPYFLLSGRKVLQERYRSKYKYIFIDEFQDTNIAQARLMTLLYKKGHNNIMIVGDDDQGIYSFRGACIDNILNFDKWDCFDKDEIKNFFLSTNFRSGPEIIDSVHSIISQNENRFEKEFKAFDKNKESLVLFNNNKTIEEEARSLVENIEKIISFSGIKLKDMAIISRRKRFDAITEALKKNNIKYELIGGRNFYFEPEILFIVSWLKVINNVFDEVSIIHILKSAKYCISDRDIFFLKKGNGIVNNTDIINMIEQCESNSLVSSDARARLKSFLERLLYYIGRSRMLDLKELISLIFEDTGLSDELKSDFKTSTKIKLSNIENLIRVASDFQQSYQDTGLESFIVYLKDIAKTDYDNRDKIEISRENSIKLMSIHASKGLEFEAVFLPMLWKNDYMGRGDSGKNGFVVPSELRNDASIWREKKNYRSAASFNEDLKKLKMEEERRIFYVACSRAKKILFLSYSQFEKLDQKEDPACDNKKTKEITPFFMDFLKKGSHLMATNESGKDFLQKLSPEKNTYKYFDMEEIKNMFGKRGKNRSISKKNIEKPEWKKIEKNLNQMSNDIEGVIRNKKDTLRVLRAASGSKDKVPVTASVINESRKYLEGINKKLIEGKLKRDLHPDIKSANQKDQILFSLTPVLDYLECPSLYKWRYVYSIPQRPDKKMEKGELIHKYIESATMLRFEDPEADHDQYLKKYCPEDIKSYLEVFEKSEFADFSVLRPQKLMLEQLFYYKVGQYFITGKLDRVAVFGGGLAEIVDYKMAGYKKGKIPASHKNVPDRYRLQLMTYIGAVSDILGMEPDSIEGKLLYLGNGKIDLLTGSSLIIDEISGILSNAMKSISNGDYNIPEKTSCNKNCEYFELCFR
jgi:DNA helicase II / ATP-dependent DNA helicase PcrA